jgi:hypothetical protein
MLSSCTSIQLTETMTSTTPTGTITPNVSNVSYDYVRLPGNPPTVWFDGDIYLTNPGLDSVKQRMGKLWIPTYLPDGYSLARTYVTGNCGVRLTYQKDDSPNYLCLDELVCSADMRFPAGTVEKVMVSNNQAYLVHGNWINQNGIDIWSNDEALQLYFSLEGWLVGLQGYRSSYWTAEELIKVAESLKAY